jgi:hypothetical protein
MTEDESNTNGGDTQATLGVGDLGDIDLVHYGDGRWHLGFEADVEEVCIVVEETNDDASRMMTDGGEKVAEELTTRLHEPSRLWHRTQTTSLTRNLPASSRRIATTITSPLTPVRLRAS